MADTSRRCDHCGAQAYWTTWIDATAMSWCNHFFRSAEAKLRARSVDVEDHTDEMNNQKREPADVG